MNYYMSSAATQGGDRTIRNDNNARAALNVTLESCRDRPDSRVQIDLSVEQAVRTYELIESFYSLKALDADDAAEARQIMSAIQTAVLRKYEWLGMVAAACTKRTTETMFESGDEDSLSDVEDLGEIPSPAPTDTCAESAHP